MNFDNAADESLVAYYENVRRQVDADIKSGGSYRFIGESVSSMPTDLAKKWTGGDCGLRQSTGNADRTIDLARLRECDLRKDDLTSLGYRASLAGFVTHTAIWIAIFPAGYLGGIFAIVSQR